MSWDDLRSCCSVCAVAARWGAAPVQIPAALTQLLTDASLRSTPPREVFSPTSPHLTSPGGGGGGDGLN